jgi:hypothetical protein
MTDSYDEAVEFRTDLEKLENLVISPNLLFSRFTQIKEAVELIEMDTSMFGTTNHAEVSISQVYYVVRAVVKMFRKLFSQLMQFVQLSMK